MSINGTTKSPAPKWVRTIIAGGFLVVWLAVHVVSFFSNGGIVMVPFWFTGVGLVVLGYLLGINLDDVTHGLK